MPRPLLALAPAFALLLCGCKPAAAKKHAGTPADPFVIGMSQCNRGEPWRVQMDEDVKQAAAKHPNVRVVFKDAQNESLTQRAQIEELLAQGIDLLVVSPKESAPLTRPWPRPSTRASPSSSSTAPWRATNSPPSSAPTTARSGARPASGIATALGGKGKIVELKGLQTSTPGQDRHQGFLEGIDLRSTPTSRSSSRPTWSGSSPRPAARWSRRWRRRRRSTSSTRTTIRARTGPTWPPSRPVGAPRFVGIDALPHEGVKYVEEGILDATFLYPTGGPEAIALALDILAGKQPPKNVVLGTRIYTKDNAPAGARRSGDPMSKKPKIAL